MNNAMYARAKALQEQGRAEELERRRARLVPKKLEDQNTHRRPRKERAKLVPIRDTKDPMGMRFEMGQPRRIGDKQALPIDFERKVIMFVLLYNRIPSDRRLHGSDGDPKFDFMLHKRALADVYTKETGQELTRWSLNRIMTAAWKKISVDSAQK